MSAAPVALLVVGGGTAGLVAARTAAGLGGQVVLVERDRTGGDCLWTGCVPSKALLAAAGAAAGVRSAGRLGVHAAAPRVDFAAVMDHVRASIRQIEPHDSPASLRDAGVEVRHGDLAFTGPQSALIDGLPVAFDQAVVATGSRPTMPPLPGLDTARVLTSDSVWDLRSLPERLVVLGGGSIGCELGQAFARLGSTVTIVEAAERLLDREDPVASAAVTDALHADGVTVCTAVAASTVEADAEGAGRLLLEDGTDHAFTHLLVAVGRTPRTDGLGLAAAGVSVDRRGHVRTDEHLRTSNPRIWAAGDVTGRPAFTHVAGMHGSIAATNATLGLRRGVDPTVPRVTFTQPEVAAVGVSTGRPPHGVRVLSRTLAETDRAITDGRTHGGTRLAVDRKGRLLGATLVGPRAGDDLAEITLAVRTGLRARDLAGTTHAYPTYADAGWNAAIGEVRSTLERPAVARGIRALATLRRRWVEIRAARVRAQQPFGHEKGDRDAATS